MKTSDIIATLMERTPAFTDLFSEYFTPSAVTVAGKIVTITKVKHGLATGKYVTLTGAVTLTPVTSITSGGDAGWMQLETTLPHDLTEEWHTEVTLSSADDDTVDGVYPILSVDSRYSVTVTGSFADDLEDLMIHEAREYSIDGLFKITKIDDDRFSVEMDNALANNPTILASSVKVHHKVRISGGAEITRLIENYEKQAINALWAFVVLDDTQINKDRYTHTDADMEQGGGNEWNGLLLSPFSIYVFVPCENEITGRAARDIIEDVRPILYRSVVGQFFQTGFTNEPDSKVSPRGDQMTAYMKAFYVHRFQFMQVAQITGNDTASAPKTISLKVVSFDFMKTDYDTENVMISGTVEIDTPEE